MATARARKNDTEAERPRRGRPPGPVACESIRLRVSRPYKEFLETAARDLNGSVTDLIREGVRLVARSRGLPEPPLT